MINNENKKKIIVILILLLIFILLILFAFVFNKKIEEPIVEVPIGKHGKTEEKEKDKKIDISINENEIDLKATSIELSYLLKNPKTHLNNFGDSYIYDGYYVFPKRQIKIKKSYDTVLNLVFFNSYKGNIISDVNVNTNALNIVSKLGTPNYNENGVVIYKTKDYYAIFNTNNKEVSIQFRKSPNLEVFWNLYNMYLNTNDLKSYISGLTKNYPYYTEYNYDTDGLELIYADFGIRLYFKQFDSENGIYIYSNYDNNIKEYSLENIKKLPNVYYKNANLIVQEEIKRIAYEKQKKDFVIPEKLYSDNKIYKNINVLKSYANIKQEKDERTGESKEYKELLNLNKYKVYYEFNNRKYTFSNVSIISKIGNNHYNINTAKVADNLLLTENYLFYSIKNEGIFRIDVNTGIVTELYIGEGKFELKYIKNNEIYYDDTKTRAI